MHLLPDCGKKPLADKAKQHHHPACAAGGELLRGLRCAAATKLPSASPTSSKAFAIPSSERSLASGCSAELLDLDERNSEDVKPSVDGLFPQNPKLDRDMLSGGVHELQTVPYIKQYFFKASRHWPSRDTL